ncbi:MAG TPA: HEAT repeat domain-containing protein [Acidimicrobiales bacterium]|nr:HEAT repeat domain-containing protein [Acidimicrobiales bacterium]
MIDGEAVAAGAALAVASAGLLALVLSSRKRHKEAGGADVEAEVRRILFRAIDEGDLAAETVHALTPAQHEVLEHQARALLPSLRGKDRDTLGVILDRLGAVEAARRQARSKRAAARAEAGEFLGESGSPGAVRDLVQLLHDPDAKVRWAAAHGLGRLGHPSAVPALLNSIDGKLAVPVDVVASAVAEIRECPVPLLREGLASPSVPRRALTVELLGRFQALVAADEVIDLLHSDPSVEVRARAARSLGRMGSPRAVQPLLGCVEDGPVATRAQAIWALGEMGALDAIPALRTTLLGSSHHLGELAADALAAMGPAGLRVLGEIAGGSGSAAPVAARTLAAHRSLQIAKA